MLIKRPVNKLSGLFFAHMNFISTFKRIKNNRSMARAMFEYCKTVLEKVSFSVDLFCKELEKAIERLLPHEQKELEIWVRTYILDRPDLSICLVRFNP